MRVQIKTMSELHKTYDQLRITQLCIIRLCNTKRGHVPILKAVFSKGPSNTIQGLNNDTSKNSATMMHFATRRPADLEELGLLSQRSYEQIGPLSIRFREESRPIGVGIAAIARQVGCG